MRLSAEVKCLTAAEVRACGLKEILRKVEGLLRNVIILVSALLLTAGGLLVAVVLQLSTAP
jgi:hypothetical protein